MTTEYDAGNQIASMIGKAIIAGIVAAGLLIWGSCYVWHHIRLV